VTQEDIRILYAPIKTYYANLEIINATGDVIDEVEGLCVGGSFTIDANSPVRRTCSLSLVNDKESFTDEDSRIWLDKTVRIKIGTHDRIADVIVWNKFGTLKLQSVNFSYSVGERTINVSCGDLMTTLNGDLKGRLEGYITKIEMGENIKEVVIKTISQLGDITDYRVDEDENIDYRTTPYTMEFPVELTPFDILVKLRDLYPAWEMFFDADGKFIWQKIPTCEFDNDVFTEEIIGELIATEGYAYDFTKIKNCVHVLGSPNEETELEAKVMLVNTMPDSPRPDVEYVVNPDSPFSVEKIGERWQLGHGGEYDWIYTEQLCLERAEYDLWLATNMNSSFDMSTILIPWLDVNNKFSHFDASTGTTKQYITKNISFDLSAYQMRISSIQYFPLYPFLVGR